jgi:hypothetical protein
MTNVVAAEVRRRILLRKPDPPPYVGGYAQHGYLNELGGRNSTPAPRLASGIGARVVLNSQHVGISGRCGLGTIRAPALVLNCARAWLRRYRILYANDVIWERYTNMKIDCIVASTFSP